jgi:hypothetical protein
MRVRHHAKFPRTGSRGWTWSWSTCRVVATDLLIYRGLRLRPTAGFITGTAEKNGMLYYKCGSPTRPLKLLTAVRIPRPVPLLVHRLLAGPVCAVGFANSLGVAVGVANSLGVAAKLMLSFPAWCLGGRALPVLYYLLLITHFKNTGKTVGIGPGPRVRWEMAVSLPLPVHMTVIGCPFFLLGPPRPR